MQKVNTFRSTKTLAILFIIKYRFGMFPDMPQKYHNSPVPIYPAYRQHLLPLPFFKLTLTHAVHFCTFFITNKSFPIYNMSLHSFAPFPIYNNPTGSHRVIASLVFHHLSRPGSFPGSIIIRNSIFATKIPLPDYSQIFIARAFTSISF